jgi:hypothetical protein
MSRRVDRGDRNRGIPLMLLCSLSVYTCALGLLPFLPQPRRITPRGGLESSSCENWVNGGGGVESTTVVVDRGSQPHNVLSEWSHSLVGGPRSWSRGLWRELATGARNFLLTLGEHRWFCLTSWTHTFIAQSLVIIPHPCSLWSPNCILRVELEFNAWMRGNRELAGVAPLWGALAPPWLGPGEEGTLWAIHSGLGGCD